MTNLRPPGVTLQPMLHVTDMSTHLALFERLGGRIAFGSGDGDWALVQFGETEIALLAHPPNPEQGEGALELQFVARVPLEEVRRGLDGSGWVVGSIAEAGFGRQLQLKTPDGVLVKVNEIDRARIG